MSRVAHAFSSFAAENPAVYDAMFTPATRLRFGGTSDTPAPLSAPFVELRETVAPVAGGRDVETLIEVLWAALHGLTTLARKDRSRPGLDTDRIQLLVAQFDDRPLPKTLRDATVGRADGVRSPGGSAGGGGL
ncbi:MAG: TetR-like C-terminal domain-containing protein [Solirubrobacteraceae bacterium]